MVFLNNKAIILSTILTLGIFGGGIWFVHKNSQLEIKTEPLVTASSQPKTQEEILDSDSDGLKDWEEKLWGTDPNNPDTDGDGTIDSEEIAANRNPLKAGPNDFLTNTSAFASTNSKKTAPLSNTPSQEFSRDFFANVIALKNQGWTDEEIQTHLSFFLAPPVTIVNSASKDRYGIADISVSPNSSEEVIKDYANQIGAILVSSFKDLTWNELLILTQLLNAADNENTKEKFALFETYQNAYANAAQKILETPVPASYRDTHLEIINAFETLSKTNAQFRALPNDFFAAPLAITAHHQTTLRLNRALATMATQLQRERISISSSDSAFVLISKELKPSTQNP